MLKHLSSMNSGMTGGSTMDASSPEFAPKAEAAYSVEEEETDSGSSSVGEEEVSCSFSSEEEVEAVKTAGYSPPQPQHLFSLEHALDPPPQKPARTKLSSSALVFVPGASSTNTKSVDAGRSLLTLLKCKATDSPSGLPSESQQKPSRSKLSSSAQAFVPKARFIPQQDVVQPVGFSPIQPLVENDGFPNCAPPMVQLLPTLMIPMAMHLTNFDDSYVHDGFDDSPRASYLESDSQTEVVKDADTIIQQSAESEEVISKAPPKVSWADLYEDEEEAADIWFEEDATQNALLSLS